MRSEYQRIRFTSSIFYIRAVCLRGWLIQEWKWMYWPPAGRIPYCVHSQDVQAARSHVVAVYDGHPSTSSHEGSCTIKPLLVYLLLERRKRGVLASNPDFSRAVYLPTRAVFLIWGQESWRKHFSFLETESWCPLPLRERLERSASLCPIPYHGKTTTRCSFPCMVVGWGIWWHYTVYCISFAHKLCHSIQQYHARHSQQQWEYHSQRTQDCLAAWV